MGHEFGGPFFAQGGREIAEDEFGCFGGGGLDHPAILLGCKLNSSGWKGIMKEIRSALSILFVDLKVKGHVLGNW